MNDHAFRALVLQTLAAAHFAEQRLTLDSLTDALGVRRSDVRTAISALDREGHVDALRFRLTLSGLAVGHALAREPLVSPGGRRSGAPLATAPAHDRERGSAAA